MPVITCIYTRETGSERLKKRRDLLNMNGVTCMFATPAYTEIVICGWRYVYANNALEARINLFDFVRGWTTYKSQFW